MTELLPVSIGIGLAVSLLFSMFFGLAAGGMVVPGYFALHFSSPVAVVLTILAGIVAYLIVRLLSTIAIIYGRRRTVMMILVGYLVRMMMDSVVFDSFRGTEAFDVEAMRVIGYIIPGLIAIWIDRQGLVETIASLLTAAVVVRLILILALGAELQL